MSQQHLQQQTGQWDVQPRVVQGPPQPLDVNIRGVDLEFHHVFKVAWYFTMSQFAIGFALGFVAFLLMAAVGAL